MDRLACINVPGLALQVALRRFPPGYSAPLVLVKDDRPTSLILNLNRAAKNQGLRVGMRYSEALTITREARAVTVSEQEAALARQEILEILTRWSPQVETCLFDTGSFWLNSSGLSALYGSEARWGSSVREALTRQRYRAYVVVGHSRGGTYVLARARRRSAVVLSPEAEQRAWVAAPLNLFPLTVRQRRLLERLDIATLGALLDIPAAELARRLGPELGRTLRGLNALDSLPLQSAGGAKTTLRARRLDPPVADRQFLLPLLLEPLDDGLRDLVRRGRLLAELRLAFHLESRDVVSEVLRPAVPTTSRSLLLKLLELRLEHTDFPSPVAEIRLAFLDAALPPGSGDLFAPPVVRDLARGAEALAVLRAQWGNSAVVRPVLSDNHAPELAYRWEEVEQLRAPVPRRTSPGPHAVRRIPFSPQDGNPSGQRVGPVCRLRVFSGGRLLDKEYWFLRNRRGEVAWVSWDRQIRASAWEGAVD